MFDEILEVINQHPKFECLQMKDESMISLPGIEIYPGCRKIYHDRREINLTAKEYDLLCLLVVNRGYVLTYAQIYEKVWGEDSLGAENNSVGCHVRSLRRKLCQKYPDAPFTIRCLRNIGYCLEIENK